MPGNAHHHPGYGACLLAAAFRAGAVHIRWILLDLPSTSLSARPFHTRSTTIDGVPTTADYAGRAAKAVVYALPPRDGLIVELAAGQAVLPGRLRALGYTRVAAVEIGAGATVPLAGDVRGVALVCVTCAGIADAETAAGVVEAAQPTLRAAGLVPALASAEPLGAGIATFIPEAHARPARESRPPGAAPGETGRHVTAPGQAIGADAAAVSASLVPAAVHRPIHLDVDLSRAGSFTWITADLARALAAAGATVTVEPGALSPTIPDDLRDQLQFRQGEPAPGAAVAGWNHFQVQPRRARDVELFVTNYEVDPSRGPLDPWLASQPERTAFQLPLSELCRGVLLATGVPHDRCAVFHLGYTPDVDLVADAAFIPGCGVKLLAVTNAHDLNRYGTDLLLAAYERAFRPSDAVSLVIRDYGAYSRDLAAAADRLRRRGFDVLYFARLLDRPDMIRFYRGCDALVAPFRGEGFGIKVLDALACGLPVVAPRYGGPADFLSAENAVPVHFRRVPVGDCLDRHLLKLGDAPLWCEVDVDDLAAKLRATCASLPAATRRASAASADLRRRFSWDAAARRLLAIVDGLPATRAPAARPEPVA